MKYGYARYRRTARAWRHRSPSRGRLAGLEAGDVFMVTRLDRLARSTRDLLNTLGTIADRKAGFRSLGDTWADTTTAHGRLMFSVLGGLADDPTSSAAGAVKGENAPRHEA